eukprot:g31797.t1
MAELSEVAVYCGGLMGEICLLVRCRAEGAEQHEQRGLLDAVPVIKLKEGSPASRYCGRQAQMSVRKPQEAKEASSPIPKLGVSVSLLLATYQRWEAAAAGATTDDVVRDLVKPATADQKCSYVELLARSQDPQDRAGVATATVFLSYAWKYTFKQVVEAIAAHWPDKDNVRSQTFLWFDIFTVNQHQTSTVDADFWFEAFRENVRTIGRTVLILSPWRNPVPLTRARCLWEIFCTRLTEASFEICLSPTEVTDFEHALVKDFDSILGSLSRIDIKKAEAGKKEDQEKILAFVEGMEGGAHELNKAVLAKMRAWVVQAGRDALQAKEGQTDEAIVKLMDSVGTLIQDLGDLKGAEEFFRRSLEAREKMLGPEHMHTLASVNYLATLLCDQGKLAEAEPLYRRALQGQEKTLGTEHPETLASWRAEPLFRRALRGEEKTLGAEHPETLTLVNNLAGLLYQQGKLAKAEPLYRRARQGLEITLGAEHPHTLGSVYNLADLLEQQSKLAVAEALYRRELQGCEKALGAEHPDTLASVKNLVRFLEQQGKVAEAEALKLRAQEAKRCRATSRPRAASCIAPQGQARARLALR